MEKDTVYSQLARKSPGQKLGLLGAVLGAGGLIYWLLVLSPLQDERGQLSSRKASQIKTQSELDEKLAKKRKLLDLQAELKALIAANEKALPTEAELPTLFKHLQRKAGDAGVNIQRWDYKKEEPVDVYIKVPVAIELTGTFHNIMRYFALLGPEGTFAEPVQLATARGGGTVAASGRVGEEEAAIKQRIVSIEDFELGGARVRDGSVVLTAKFIASTFRQQEPTEDEKAKAEKAKADKAKADKAKAEQAKAAAGAAEPKGNAAGGGASTGGAARAPGGGK